MRHRIVMVFVLAAAALLQGCVRDQLVRQETKAFAATANDATAAGTKFYEELIDGDRALYATFYLLDASCRPPAVGEEIYWLKKSRPKTPDRWCADAAASDTHTLTSEFSYSSFEREFAALSFVAEYLAALTELAADPEAKAATQFADAAADLNTLLAAAKKDPVLNKDQIEAAVALFGLLEQLSADAKSAREIRALLKEKGAQASDNFKSLSESLLKDAGFKDAELKARIATATIALKFGNPSDPFLRQTVLAGYYDTIDLERGLDRLKKNCDAKAKPEVRQYCGATAAGLMHAAAVAHTDLINLAAGDLNDKQKAKEAKLAYARFIGVVRLFVSLTGAF